MTWLWIVLYLILGIVVARWFTARSSPISRTDACALVVVWPAFFLFLALRAGVNGLGGLAGGRD
jgi:Na+/proline symporter